MIFFATASANQNDLVEKEARAAGSDDVKLSSGGVFFKADLKTAYNFCLWSRSATRLLVLFHQEEIEDMDTFYEHSASLAWENWINPEVTFAITETVTDCYWIRNSHFASVRLKDAIVDRIKSNFEGERPNVDRENPDLVFHLHVNRNTVSYYADFSGRLLAKRGYRKAQTTAVLAEFLASTVISRSPWRKEDENEVLLDPFCGSGIICIEAALMLSNSAPGLIDPNRFAFYKLPFHDEAIWKEAFEEAENAQIVPKNKIYGWDIDPEAIAISKKNAKAAGMDQFIEFECKDFTKITKADKIAETGTVVTDPPYGHRLDCDSAYLKNLYKQSGINFVEVFGGWHISILCADSSLLSYVDMKPYRTNTLFNGGLECQLAHYYVYTDAERAEMIDKAINKKEERLNTPLSDGAQMAANRLTKNIKALQKDMEAENVSCYRIYDADMPEYSAAIDVYENKWINLQEYAAPSTIEVEDAQKRLDELILATERVTGIDIDNIYVKQRTMQKGNDQYNKSSKANGEFYIIHENAHSFRVNFTDYLDTGIFLDHRPIRTLIQALSKDKRFLNLFCYTGTASVYAAAGGALSTVSVDSSNAYLSWAQKNLEINGFTSLNHFLYRDDCLNYLSSSFDKYDLIFCDPPTFSNSKDREVFDIQYDHSRLVKACMGHLSSKGLLIFSTNFKKFAFDEYLSEIFKVEDISEHTIGKDFERNPKIHYCFLIRHKDNEGSKEEEEVIRKVLKIKRTVVRRPKPPKMVKAFEAVKPVETVEIVEAIKPVETVEIVEAVKEPKVTKTVKEPKATKVAKETKATKVTKAPKVTKETKVAKAPKVAKEPKATKESKVLKETKVAKEKKIVKEVESK